MNERLEKIRKLSKLSKKDFCNQIEITPMSYSNYMKGIRQIKTETAIKIRKLFNISIDWLLLGEGEMFVDKDKIKIKIEENQNSHNSSEVDEDEFTKQIIEDLKTLDKNAKKKIYLEILTKLEKNEII